MKLTIIVEDKWVAVDGVGYSNIDMSSLDPDIWAVQWFGQTGWIEYCDIGEGKKPNQQIDSITQFKTIIDLWNDADYLHKNPPVVPPSAQQNMMTAKDILVNTDWTQMPDVQLKNKEEFAAYRAIIREIILNPREGFLEWPVIPKEVW